MKECSKSVARRLADSNFTRNYFVGSGLDIGGKPDPLALYKELFCQMTAVKTWDWEDGDAQFLAGVPDASFDFVHSSHCLEHLVDPVIGLANWLRVVRPGGHLVVTVPDEDLYEQGIFPSTFNRDHKWTFTIFKQTSWSPKSVNLLDLVRGLGSDSELVRMEQLAATYRFELPRFDQSLTPVGECGIEFVIRKRMGSEIVDQGRWRRPVVQPERELRVHLNQYSDDMKRMKQANVGGAPFLNDGDV
jgi:SAM-dependent methyltransferase